MKWLNKLNRLAYIDRKRLEQIKEANDAVLHIRCEFWRLWHRQRWAIKEVQDKCQAAIHQHDPRKCFECKAKPRVRKRKLESILKKAKAGKALTSEEILIFNESRPAWRI